MSEQNLILNVLTFSPAVKTKTFAFYTEKKDNYYPLSKREFPLNINEVIPKEKLDKLDCLYTNFQLENDDKAISITVDMLSSKNFAKHYYNWMIYNFFQGKADVTNSNFIYDNELWFSNKEESKHGYNAYSVFTIKVQIGRITKQPELLLSYNGVSKVHTKSLKQLDYNTTLYKWVVYKGKLYKYKELPVAARYNDYEEVFPVINYKLSVEMDLLTESKYNTKKYQIYYNNINGFYKKYINTTEFKNIIPVDEKGFLTIEKSKIKSTTLGSNLLVFGQDKTGVIPYYGVRDYGPYFLPPLLHIKFIFILHESDRSFGNELFEWFKGKKGKFKGLKTFLKLNFVLDIKNSIVFNNLEDPIIEIREQLSDKVFDVAITHIGIYITPFTKLETDSKKRKLYFQIKQELLKYNITSQVIDKQTISKDDFNLSLSNISVAMLAKLGGIPWRLNCPINNELIVGVGAFKNLDLDEKYVGSAFCFSNDGQFKGFECYCKSDTYMLAVSIKDQVKKYREQNEKIERLVIHFYKKMSRRELEPIEKELKELELDIPIIIVTINKTVSKDIIAFDTNHHALIPISGTFIQIGRNEYLLYNNTRYRESEIGKTDGYPFPIKIKIASKHTELLEDYKTIKDLIDQVYQFSRMYWKSVKQQSLPVTIKYPEMMAEIFPYFENGMPPFGKNNLWFL